MYVKRALGLDTVRPVPGLVTLIGRRKYLAHPRMNMQEFNAPNITVSRSVLNEVRCCFFPFFWQWQ